jgi:DNA polymerase-3 subunit epsilon
LINDRIVVLDTETTGLSFKTGDRLIEIGCVEMVDMKRTGATLHLYLDPGRPVPYGAFAVHGISETFLAYQPSFEEVAYRFLDFIGDDAALVAHNAAFDIGFINGHLGELGLSLIDKRRVIDTMVLARRRFPGQKATLDTLVKRFGIGGHARDMHGALLDAEILADVFVSLAAGFQEQMIADATLARTHAKPDEDELEVDDAPAKSGQVARMTPEAIQALRVVCRSTDAVQGQGPGLVIEPSEAEREAHAGLVRSLKGSLWQVPEPAGKLKP